MSTYLITGVAGFIGYHTAKTLLLAGHNVIGIDAMVPYYDLSLKKARLSDIQHACFEYHEFDVGNFDKLKDLLGNVSIDYIIHLAAQPGVRYSIDHPFEYGKHNLSAMLSIMEFARLRQAEIKQFVFASSSSVYGLENTVPFSVDSKILSPMSLYAATKIADEAMAYSYAHLYKIPTVGLRFFTVYGPFGRPDMAVFSFTQNIDHEKEITLFEKGQLKRDFTYVDDIVAGIIASCKVNHNASDPYKIYNLGNNNPEKVTDLVSYIEKFLGKKAIIKDLPMSKGDMRETYADISLSQKELGFQPTVALEKGTELFVEWYKKYYYT
ncbi:MAG: GDP-mannose 4,6-dehydratase [Alphaproteobacteria bacterium]|nr:GDP-mannose 4,6-dehydratase [Alphaproteobacteria bacterium]OJV15310.1 MAG: hypothetical protein BGO27_02245 [Alphaproteobacteria bacterium 33-17]